MVEEHEAMKSDVSLVVFLRLPGEACNRDEPTYQGISSALELCIQPTRGPLNSRDQTSFENFGAIRTQTNSGADHLSLRSNHVLHSIAGDGRSCTDKTGRFRRKKR